MPTPKPPPTSTDVEVHQLLLVLLRRLRDARLGRYGSGPAVTAEQIRTPDSLHHRFDEFDVEYLSEVAGRIVAALGTHRRSHRAMVTATRMENL